MLGPRTVLMVCFLFLPVVMLSAQIASIPNSTDLDPANLYPGSRSLFPPDDLPVQLPPAGGVGDSPINFLENAAPNGGGFGVTVDDETGRVYVAELLSGEAVSYDLDLDPASIQTLPAPGGAADPMTNFPQTTGIAWVPNPQSPGSGFLYWIVATGQGGNGQFLHDFWQTNVLGGGATLLASDLESPGQGQLGGMTHHETQDLFVINDILADRYYFFDYNGLFFTGNSFPNPNASSFGANGNGIAHVDSSNCFDIITGAASAGGTDTLYRVDEIGTIGQSIQVANPFNPFGTGTPAGSPAPIWDGFLQDYEWHSTGSGLGGPQTGGVLYAFGGATQTLFEISAFDDCPDCNYSQITNFECTQVGGVVTGNYTENSGYSSVAVYRDGVLIANQPAPGDGQFTDDTGGVPGDGFVYEIRTVINGVECPGGTCSIAIPLPGQVVAQHAGENPYGITIVEDDDLVLVSDLETGVAYYYTKELAIVSTIPSPAPAVTLGVVWQPDTDQLYWIDGEVITMTNNAYNVIITDTDGGFINTFIVQSPIQPPGNLGPIALNADGTGLLFYDLTNHIAFETDFLGLATGFDFENSPGTAYSNGITRVPDGSGYELGSGSATDPTVNGAFVARAPRFDSMGASVGCASQFGPGQWVDDSAVNEIALTDGGGPGGLPGEFRYVVGSAQNLLYAEPSECNPCFGPTGGTEGRMISNQVDVTASWIDPGTFTSHEVFRDGQLIATLPGDATEYSEAVDVAGDGLHFYTIQSTCFTGGVFETVSEVFVFTVAPSTTDLVINAETQGAPFTDSASALFESLSGAGRDAALIDGFVGNDLSAFTGVWFAGGTGVAAHLLTVSEKETLATFALSGTANDPKALYLERGLSYFEPVGTTLDEIDHMFFSAPLEFVPRGLPGFFFLVFGGQCLQMLGQNSTGGIDLDMAGILANIDGENGSQDATFKLPGLFPDADDDMLPDPLGTPGVSDLFGNTAPVGFDPVTVVVVGDSELSGVGNGAVFKIVNSAVEFGAFTPIASRTEIMERYVDWFYPFVPPTGDEFIRGDADGNGSYSGLVDGLYILNFQFSGGNAPPCMKAADLDDSGSFSGLVDGLYCLNFQFVVGSPPPPPPFPACGEDPTMDPLSCDDTPPCP